MKDKVIRYGLYFAITLLIAYGGVVVMQKELPYDFEVVPGDSRLWVVKLTTWLDRDCFITVEGNGISKKTFDLTKSTKFVALEGLKNGQQYVIKIGRKDLLGKFRYRPLEIKAAPSFEVKKYIVFVGASVGKSWDLPHFADRTTDKTRFIGYRTLYEFDKTPIIEDLKTDPVKPEMVIIKECAAYFPRDVEPGIRQVKEWTMTLQKQNIQPVLATVVPITKARDEKKKGRMDSINKFNAAIRQLGKANNVPVMDLQAVLSDGSAGAYLKEEYAAEDGLHLKPETYKTQLDPFMERFLKATR